MYVYVCVYIYIYICISLSLYIYIYICIHIGVPDAHVDKVAAGELTRGRVADLALSP